MRALTLQFIPVTVAAALAFTGCASNEPASQEADITEDRFLSDRSTEFRVVSPGWVSGLDQADAERLAPLKARAMAGYLTVFLRQKHDLYDKYNLDYGDFNGLVRNESVENMNLHPQQGGFAFDVELLAAAQSDLLERLAAHPYATDVSADTVTIRVPMRAMSELELEETATGGLHIDDFNPETTPDADLEWFDATFRAEPYAADAYPDYWGLYEGGPAAPGYEQTGTLDVAVFYGYDEDGNDTANARQTWEWLWRQGFQRPVSTFEELEIDSAPSEVEFLADGGQIPMRLRVSLIHSRVVGATDASLRQRFVDAFANADVIIYNGHAWLYHGFYLGQGDASAIPSDEIPSLHMPSDRSQILVANGCATYANYAGKVYEIPGKSPENLDVFTTMNISAIAVAPAFVEIIVESLTTKGPQTYLDILGHLNNDERYLSYPTVFGVHGIEDNPRAHPFADHDKLCEPCERRSDCGYSTGTTCTSLVSGGDQFCATICLDDSGCPGGYACMNAPDAGPDAKRKYCMPAPEPTCGGGDGGGGDPEPPSEDPCVKYELYGDGLCDYVCFEPDPDCA